MNNGQRTVTTMLAVVAVLLGLNLIVRGSPPAVAQGPTAAGPVQPTLVNGVAQWPNTTSHHIYRFWSDGAVDFTRFRVPANCVPTVECAPVTVIPGTCAGDVDRDGIVGVPDLLTTLAAWGPCL